MRTLARQRFSDWRTALCIAFSIFILGAGFTNGAIFVKIPGIPGEVTAEGYNDGNWFEAFSGSYGVERTLEDSIDDGTASLNIGVGRLLPIGVACHLNRAAAPLAQAAASGDTVGDIEIHLVDLGPEPLTFCIIRLKQAFVKDFTMETRRAGRPWFQSFFAYRHIEIVNRLSSPEGLAEQTVRWNLMTETDEPLVPEQAMQTWLDQFFTEEQQQSPAVGGLFIDLDNDGLTALAEYKLGLNPWDTTDGRNAVEHWMVDAEGEQFLEISFVQLTDASTPLTRLKVEAATDLQDWKSDEETVVLISRTPLENDREHLVYRLARSQAEEPEQFVRLSVVYSGQAE
jgi:hypothetical protein